MKKVITGNQVVDMLIILICYSIGGPIIALLYCLGMEEEESRKKALADKQKSEPVKVVVPTVKMAENSLFTWPAR